MNYKNHNKNYEEARFICRFVKDSPSIVFNLLESTTPQQFEINFDTKNLALADLIVGSGDTKLNIPIELQDPPKY